MTLKIFIEIAAQRFSVQEVTEWKDGKRYYYLRRLLPPGAWLSVTISHLALGEELLLSELQSLCAQLRLPLSAFGISTS